MCVSEIRVKQIRVNQGLGVHTYFFCFEEETLTFIASKDKLLCTKLEVYFQLGFNILFSEAVFFHPRVFTSCFLTLELDRCIENYLRKTSTDFLFAALCSSEQNL